MSAVAIVWTLISFFTLILAVIVIFPARREYEDARMEAETLGNRLDGTRIIVESEMSVRRYIALAQLMGACVMMLFLFTGIASLLLPQPTSDPGETLASFLPWLLIAAELFEAMCQVFLAMGTVNMRHSRQKWREEVVEHEDFKEK